MGGEFGEERHAGLGLQLVATGEGLPRHAGLGRGDGLA